MREAIGGTWLFNIVIFFVLLFTGYMCLSINYSKAFNVKDKIINEIERSGGIKNISNSDGKDPTINAITAYLQEVGYRTTGNCADYDYGCDRNGKCTSNPSGSGYAYCLKEVKASDTYSHATRGEFIFVSYYKIKVFYQLDLPILRQIFGFSIKGDTKLLYDITNAKK